MAAQQKDNWKRCSNSLMCWQTRLLCNGRPELCGPESPHAGDVVTFDGSNSLGNQPGGEISNWQWDLDGDGTIDQNGPTVAKIYSAPGRYRIVLNVSDNSNPPSIGRRVLFLQISE